MLKNLNEAIYNKLLYSLRRKVPELDKIRFLRGCPLLLFSTLPESVTQTLNFVRAQPPQVKVTELVKYVNVVE